MHCSALANPGSIRPIRKDAPLKNYAVTFECLPAILHAALLRLPVVPRIMRGLVHQWCEQLPATREQSPNTALATTKRPSLSGSSYQSFCVVALRHAYVRAKITRVSLGFVPSAIPLAGIEAESH
jgi:hypothetical protein